MSVRATCACGAEFNAKPGLAGKTVKCPTCGGQLTVPRRKASRPPILVKCKCGSSFKAKPDLAGKQLSCPSCAQPLKVPNPYATAARIRVACTCGRAFKVKSEMARKRAKCPACQQLLTIPDPTPTEPTSPATVGSGGWDDDPLGVGTAQDDPLGLGNMGKDLLGSGLPPVTRQVGRTLPTSSAAARRDTRRKHIASGRQQYDLERILEIAVGILAIYHGGATIYHAFFRVAAMIRLSRLIGIRGFVSFDMLLFVAGVVIAAGVLAGGIGVLMRREWGLQIGVPSSYAYFCLLGLNLVFALIGFARVAAEGAGDFAADFLMGVFLRMLPRIIGNCLGPAGLIFLDQRQDE